MIRHKCCILSAWFSLACAPIALSQTSSVPLTYDVVSVRPSNPSSDEGRISPLPNGVGYNAVGVPVSAMLSVMYRIPHRQIVGGPSWVYNANFDVLVRADHRYSIDDLHAMFQNMLADRFHLKLHIEIRTGPVYALTLAKSGLKMTPVAEQQLRNSPIFTNDDTDFTGTSVPMNYLCFWLGMKLQEDQRPVIDKTDLTGHYDFKLTFRPLLPPDASEPGSLPSIFHAVKDQLGLQLIPQQGPVPTLVIDHIEKPSEN
ncbi:MAG TPA: TIGR03435 family protein [Acidobacteriaceae bacterium]|nr:TIGR03435 family protein [Acidobacteriaceae bacterium]